MTYINYKPNNDPHLVETIDEFETRTEAVEMLHEYRLAYGDYQSLYLSRRPTQDWSNK